MATVTSLGAAITTLQTFRTRIDAIYRSVYGEDLDLGTQTPQGQFSGLFAQALAEVSEAIVQVANGLNLASARRGQLDALVSLLLLERRDGTNSAVTVTFTGTPTTVIPAGTELRSRDGDSFLTSVAGAIGAAPMGSTEGTVDVLATAVAEGPVPVDAGTIIRLAEGLVGVTSVTNAADGVVGSAGETDTTLHRRYVAGLDRAAQGHLGAIASAFLEQDTVDRVAVDDNPTDAQATIQGLDIGAYTTAVVVIWADGVTGSQALFDSIIATVHNGALPRQYEQATALDTTINITAAGISSTAIAAAQQAIRDHVNTLPPGEPIQNADLLFRAKLAVTILSENPGGVTAITITPPSQRNVEAKRSNMATTGITLAEYINATVT